MTLTPRVNCDSINHHDGSRMSTCMCVCSQTWNQARSLIFIVLVEKIIHNSWVLVSEVSTYSFPALSNGNMAKMFQKVHMTGWQLWLFHIQRTKESKKVLQGHFYTQFFVLYFKLRKKRRRNSCLPTQDDTIYEWQQRRDNNSNNHVIYE